MTEKKERPTAVKMGYYKEDMWISLSPYDLQYLARIKTMATSAGIRLRWEAREHAWYMKFDGKFIDAIQQEFGKAVQVTARLQSHLAGHDERTEAIVMRQRVAGLELRILEIEAALGGGGWDNAH